MDRGAWWAMVHRVTKSRTRLKQPNMHAEAHLLGQVGGPGQARGGSTAEPTAGRQTGCGLWAVSMGWSQRRGGHFLGVCENQLFCPVVIRKIRFSRFSELQHSTESDKNMNLMNHFNYLFIYLAMAHSMRDSINNSPTRIEPMPLLWKLRVPTTGLLGNHFKTLTFHSSHMVDLYELYVHTSTDKSGRMYQ